MKAARAAVASTETGQDRAALICLIEAIGDVNQDLDALEEGKQASGVLRMPIHSDVNQRGP